MAGSGVGAYVAQIDRVLGAAEGVFAASGGPGAVTSRGPNVPAAPRDSALGVGAGTAGAAYGRGWGAVTALDDDATGAGAAGAAQGRAGRIGAGGVRRSAAGAAAAIAPVTGSPAGVRTLVARMDDRLAAMQRQLDATRAQNRLLAVRMRQLAIAYRQITPTIPTAIPGGIGRGPGTGLPGLGGSAHLRTSPSAGAVPARWAADLFGAGTGSDRANRAVAAAKSRRGAPYVWGATGPNAFDCSGLVQWAYRQAGVSLPRTTYDLVHSGRPVSRDDVRAGDLILCNWHRGRPEHVVMAVSPDMVIEAPRRGEPVQLSSLPRGRLEIRRVA